jgi:hypothetical protein
LYRFLYTNELLFDETQDHVRNLVTQQSIGTDVARSILVTSTNHHSNEWDWRHLNEEYGEPLSATVSADHDTRSVTSTTSTSTKPKPSITIPITKTTSRTRKEPISPTREITHSRASSSSYSTSTTRTAGKGTYPRATVDVDPHSHPTVQPHPACAMSIYMLAHQYRIEALEELAKKHILSHLTHSSCIPVL